MYADKIHNQTQSVFYKKLLLNFLYENALCLLFLPLQLVCLFASTKLFPGAFADNTGIVSPSSGTNAATYTRLLTLGSAGLGNYKSPPTNDLLKPQDLLSGLRLFE